MSQDSSPPPSAIQKVPVGKTIRAAYSAVFGSLGLLVKAAALPFLLSLAVLGLSFMAGGNAFLSFILTGLGFVPYTLFGVAWHRLTLLGPHEGAPVAFPSWHRRHWRFLSYVAGVTLAIYLITSPLQIAMGLMQAGKDPGLGLFLILAMFAGVLLFPYLLMRICFVFPAAAVDEAYTLAHAWAHTRGQGFRLLITLIVTALPMMVIIWLVSSVLSALFLPGLVTTMEETGQSPGVALRNAISEHPMGFVSMQLVFAVLSYVLTALMVSVVSIAFCFCTGWVPAAPGTPLARTESDPEP